MSKSDARAESFIDRIHPLKPKMKEVLIDVLNEDGREESGRALMHEERKQVREYMGERVLMLVKVYREKLRSEINL